MSEPVNESISALMDDEANELDLRRILNEADSQRPQQQMRRYQLLRSSLQREPVAHLQLDLSGKIAASIDAETLARAPAAWLKPLGGFAVAASVAAIVVVGSQNLLGTKDGSEPSSAVPVYAQNVPAARSSLSPSNNARNNSARNNSARNNNVRTVAAGSSATADQAYQRRALAQQQQRVNAYLQIHARHASMNGNLGAVPLARTAHFEVR